MDGVGDRASVLRILIADRVNVAIGLAAAILLREAVLSKGALDSIEAILHSRINGIEAVANAVGDST